MMWSRATGRARRFRPGRVTRRSSGGRSSSVTAASVAGGAARRRSDGVLHLAALSSGSAARRDPGLAWEVNAAGTARVVEALARGRSQGSAGPVVVVVSSGEVYGSAGRGADRRDRAGASGVALRREQGRRRGGGARDGAAHGPPGDHRATLRAHRAGPGRRFRGAGIRPPAAGGPGRRRAHREYREPRAGARLPRCPRRGPGVRWAADVGRAGRDVQHRAAAWACRCADCSTGWPH